MTVSGRRPEHSWVPRGRRGPGHAVFQVGVVRRICDLLGLSVNAALRYTAMLYAPGLTSVRQ